jgi:hypothetical protein
MPAAHAKFSPSSMKRVMACPASFAYEQRAREAVEGLGAELEESSGASREGTIAHALGEAAIRRGMAPQSWIGRKLTLELDGKIESVIIEKDMADKVAAYVDHCGMLAMLADRSMAEQEVHVTTRIGVETTRDLLWGTADFIALGQDRIDVVDLKFGGMAVEVEDNPQLVCYLLGALELVEPHERPNQGAVHIVQPKLSIEPKVWEIADLNALRTEWLPRLEAAMERAIEACAVGAPGDELHKVGPHCHFCPAIIGCEFFARTMIDISAAELEELEPTSPPLVEDRYGRLVERWKAKNTIKRYFELVEAKLSADLRKGVAVPGVKIVEALGNRRWTLDDEEMISRLRNQGLKKGDFIKETLVGPAVIEKLIDNPRFMAKYVTRPTSEKLVDIDDKRPAVDVSRVLEVIGAPAPEAPELRLELDLGIEDTKETEAIEEIQL